jgi:3-oxoacyl-[acyl-carrier protein] reductase
MTLLDDDEAAIKALNLDRLPTHIVDKRVTELMDLSGKKAFVTGAGGDGLGHAIANRLAGLGADIALVGRTLEPLERRSKEIAARWGVNTVPVQADMSDWDQIHRGVSEAHEALGGLDIMINNPVMVAAGPFEKQTKDQIDLTVLGSLTMMMYGAHAALEYLLPQGSGTIINIGSVGGRIQQRGLVAYNACKAGVIGFTRNLAHEVASRGVNVFCVAPGIMIKDDLRQYLLDPQDDQQRAGRAAILEAITTQVQLGRASLPEEAANMVAFLASEAASYMCGQTIDVAGGQWMG